MQACFGPRCANWKGYGSTANMETINYPGLLCSNNHANKTLNAEPETLGIARVMGAKEFSGVVIAPPAQNADRKQQARLRPVQ